MNTPSSHGFQVAMLATSEGSEVSAPKKRTHHRRERASLWRRLLILLLAILSPLAGISLFAPEALDQVSSRIRKIFYPPNRVAFEKITHTTTYPVHPPRELDFLSRDEILEMRREVVRASGLPMNSGYAPSDEVYGGIEDGKPWWGTLGLLFYGPGSYSIEGPSRESIYLLNPPLLVGLRTTSAYVSRFRAVEGDETIYPVPVSISFAPNDNLLTIRYRLSRFDQHLRRLFPRDYKENTQLDLHTLNAQDLGFSTLKVTGTTNAVFPPGPPEMPLRSLIHLGASCKYRAGCNNTSPRVPELEFSYTELPASITLQLSGISGEVGVEIRLDP